ncbi:MAG: SMC-Scp complex subunit ScpB [Clostridia bacterium]|nr:SMC-Scp complex subunit ScpB [Clostridia bacterium]
MQLTDKEAIVEGLLFAAGDVVKTATIANIIGEEEKDIEKIIISMNKKFENENRALMIRQINDGYQMCTKADYHKYISKMYDTNKKQNLSQSAMETLAIIAYKQPVTRQEIEKLRGVNSDRSVSILSEYGLIEDVGRLDAPGRPLIYSTTDEFLRVFGYSSLKDLPKFNIEEKNADNMNVQ